MEELELCLCNTAVVAEAFIMITSKGIHCIALLFNGLALFLIVDSAVATRNMLVANY